MVKYLKMWFVSIYPYTHFYVLKNVDKIFPDWSVFSYAPPSHHLIFRSSISLVSTLYSEVPTENKDLIRIVKKSQHNRTEFRDLCLCLL